SLFIATALGIHAGFSFSAGAIDYVLMYSLPAASKNVWMLLVSFICYAFNLTLSTWVETGKEHKISCGYDH
ncbi:hypothetical protein FK513_30595, partial [Klebsiella pneumoniae]|nr:hypothetical protein [Klebsiella pneumoniae]